MRFKNTLAFILGLAILGALITACVLLYANLTKKVEVVEQNQQPEQTDQTLPTQDTTIQQSEIKDLTSMVGKEKIVVEWYKGAIKASEEEMQKMIYNNDLSVKAFNDKNENKCLDEVSEGQTQIGLPCPVYLYKVGMITAPATLENKQMYLLLSGVQEMGFAYFSFYGTFDDQTKKFVVYLTNKNAYGVETLLNPTYRLDRFINGYVSNNSFVLEYPTIINIPEQSSFLLWKEPLRDSDVYFKIGPNDNEGGIVDAAKGEVSKIYNTPDALFTTKDGTSVYFVDKKFEIQLTDGAVHVYNFIPYFFVTDEVLAQKEYYQLSFVTKIKWANGNNKNDKYEIGGDLTTGCGIGIDTLQNVVNDKKWFQTDKLVEVGKTNRGEKIYELSDKATNEFYKQFFDFGYEGSKLLNSSDNYDEAKQKLDDMSPENKLTEFVSDTPVIFWKDSWGNWRVYLKSKYKPMAECGKPVIYLYPTKDMDVKVEVKPNGGLTKTEPMYGNGWFVHATTKSDLFNYSDKTNYPYLFWEGKAYDFVTPNYGFVMSKDEVGVKMPQILAKLGLNDKETKDFLEFWQPKLEVKPYVFVTFLPQREFDKLAPLTVNPKPDTVIRVFMDYQPLSAPIKVQEPRFTTPVRNGFTVVEWGGRLH